MGLFDYVYLTYKPLGPRFWRTECQTKDLDCFMRRYWISPNGELFEIDDDRCVDIVQKPDSVQEEFKNRWLDPFDYVPNGKHGVVEPMTTTAIITIYPSIKTKEDMNDWPEATLLIIKGKVQEVIEVKQRPIWKPSQHTEP